ncbi:response regulator transcription factor [Ruminococcus sp. XPD3002]|uniref:response regulator transcription factor n=1 Tax=Ruminococcus sp. XPD3002 TaxID=1452269 RepID=UPI00091C6D8F|nr:DNA-binding response regulator, OmpR family, contains REC and winged-helix (wHTH) domain [Ruminococcus flavefaciens]
MNKILLIEDDLQICEVITEYFTNKGSAVTAVNTGDDAIEVIENSLGDHDLVLLDIMLPGTDGFSLCRKIRRTCDIPVIFITARGREEDVLYGYDLGCDDYIVKPFLLSALFMKCEALIRRAERRPESFTLVCGKITLDTRTLRCFADGNEVELPPKEFAILRYLLDHVNWVVDRNKLLDVVWGYDYFGSDRVVDNHIKKLRKALGPAGSQIKTLVGRGYKLTE